MLYFSAEMKIRLASYRDSKIELAFPIQPRSRVTIGRESDNVIQLPHEKISKHHAAIYETKQGWMIEDLQSKNGILVNGQRETEAKLANGDLIKLGPYQFYFETEVPSDDWIPSYILDDSTRTNDRTLTLTQMPRRRP